MVQTHLCADNPSKALAISPSDVSLVILAGGLGRRFGGNKQLAVIPGINKTLLELSILDAVKAGVKHVVLVINKAIYDIVKTQLLPNLPPVVKVDLAIQSIDAFPQEYAHHIEKRIKPWGTGHAVLVAKPYVKNHFIVITADDYYGENAFVDLLANWQDDNSWRMLAYPLASTLTNKGGVNRGICQVEKNKLVSVVEVFDINNHFVGQNEMGQSVHLNKASLASMTIWALTSTLFSQLTDGFSKFLSCDDSVINSEFFLPNQIQHLITAHQQVVEVIPAKDKWLGVTYHDDLADVAALLNNN